ncbi:GGDEF domain-containing protein [Comamonas phosphati]|nr:GGDEF domain-containing protein [Comamonas phosphati]
MESMVQRLSRTVAAARTLQALTRPLLEILLEVTRFESAYLTTVDEEHGVQNVLYALNAGTLQMREGLQVPWRDTPGTRALDEERMYADEVARCWGDSDAARGLGMQTCASMPVRFSSGQLYGMLCAASSESAPLAPEAESMLRLFAGMVAGFAEREQLRHALQHANQELASLAMLDALTGLPNRRSLTEELQRVIAHCRRSREWVLVGFVSLDHFKEVNDRCGHEAGDALLCTLGMQLSAAVRGSDMLARFGGDEFVMVGMGPSLDDDGDQIARDLQRRLFDASSACVGLPGGGQFSYLGASVGTVCLPPDGTDLDDALQKAGAAMYRTKAARRKPSAEAAH